MNPMPLFAYDARTTQGRRQSGRSEAPSAQELVGDLRRRGLLVLKVAPVAEGLSVGRMLEALRPSSWLPPRSLDIELSLQQMAVMLRSGLTLLTTLQAVAEYATRLSMRRVWEEVARRIQQGASLAEAMTATGRFPHLVVQLIRVGEQTGTLELVVTRASEALERRRNLRTQLLTAMAYPAIVLLAAIATATFMIVSVIPKLQVFLRTLGRSLPPMTQMLMDLADWVQKYGIWVLVGILVLTGVAIALYLYPPSRLVIDRGLLRVPLVGRLLRLGATVQFAHGLGVLLRSGITLVEGLGTARLLLRNRHAGELVGQARISVIEGSSLAEPLRRGGAFMPMLPRMVAVGETAGTLDEVLEEVATFHEHHLQVTIRRLSVLIEPAVVVVVGAIVGFVYISFFVALFSAAGGAR